MRRPGNRRCDARHCESDHRWHGRARVLGGTEVGRSVLLVGGPSPYLIISGPAPARGEAIQRSVTVQGKATLRSLAEAILAELDRPKRKYRRRR